MNPTIPRAGFTSTSITAARKKLRRNKGSIKDNYESGSSDEEATASPGPGNYLKSYHTDLFGQSNISHRHPQRFGSKVSRFKSEFIGSHLGPGQYLS